MSDTDRGIFLELPSASGQPVLHPAKPIGKAIECCGASPVSSDLSLELEQGLTVYYYQRQDFMKRPVKIESIDDSGDTVVLEFSHTGPATSAEKRSMHRVSAVMADIFVGLGDEPSCQLVDISVMGCSVLATEDYSLGELVQLTVNHEGATAAGGVIVRGSRPAGGKKTRYGLSAVVDAKSDKQLEKLLSQMTSSLQRQQLQRLARC